MEIVLLIARLLLAFIFGLAGATKIADLASARKAAISFGIPEKLAVPLGSGLPFLEMLIGLALLPTNTAWLGAIGALGLLLVFAAAIAVNLAQGQAPDCNCFGQLHSKPVSWSVFSRNLVLAAIATLIVVQGKMGSGFSAFNWLGDMKAGEIATLVLSIVAVSLLTAAVVYLRRLISQQTTLVARIEAMKKVIDEDYVEPPLQREDAAGPREGLPVGAPAPRFSLQSIGGQQVTLEDLLSNRNPVLLLFVSPNCSPCKTVLEAVGPWERDYRKQMTIALLSKGDPKEIHQRMLSYGATNLLLQGESSVAADYEVKWSPAAVLISREGKVASEMTYGDEAIRALVDQTVAAGPGLVAVKASNGALGHVSFSGTQIEVGESAPSFSLPDLNGAVVSTQDLLGEDTLLLFWDPGCRFCQAMFEDLKAFEQNPPKGAPRVAIIASGDTEQIRARARDFESLSLLDPDFTTGQLFGSNSTPSAVLIDRDGRIASKIAIGERNVLALAGVRKVVLPIAASF